MLVVVVFILNVVIWSALFNGASPTSLFESFRSGGVPPGSSPTGAATQPSPSASPTLTPPPAQRTAVASGTQAPTLMRPTFAAPPTVQAANPPPASSRSGQPFSSVIYDTDLNTQINDYLARQGDPPLKDVRVKFETDRAVLTGKAQVAGIAVDVRASGPVVARDGRPAFLVQSLDVGSVGVPDFVRSGVVDAVNETTRRLTSNLGVDVTDVKLAPGQLIVSGRIR